MPAPEDLQMRFYTPMPIERQYLFEDKKRIMKAMLYSGISCPSLIFLHARSANKLPHRSQNNILMKVLPTLFLFLFFFLFGNERKLLVRTSSRFVGSGDYQTKRLRGGFVEVNSCCTSLYYSLPTIHLSFLSLSLFFFFHTDGFIRIAM